MATTSDLLLNSSFVCGLLVLIVRLCCCWCNFGVLWISYFVFGRFIGGLCAGGAAEFGFDWCSLILWLACW